MPADNQLESTYELADVYEDLRHQILHLEPGTLGPSAPGEARVIAVLMETGFPEAVATLVAVADGAASLYFSNGGGIIGAGEHEPVRAVSISLIASAQEYLSQATPTDTFPLPSPGGVRFYLVTGNGVYAAQGNELDLGHQRHPFSGLFHEGHELIAAIREHAPE